ncbi:MAG: protein kinase, partial [Ilumatobacter sp.]|nr:protein kinase [Ilumatobacter sp.]
EAVAAEPLRERRRALLALALYRAGRQAEALRAIQEYRAELADEVGLDPSADLDELEHRILEHDPGLLPASHQRHVLRGYELDEVIGEGAFSLVWRGVQPALNRTVAVKQIRAELANQPDFIRRFETEAQTVAALEHPHIVPLYDYWREPDSAYLVMRYVAGGTLEAEVLAHRLDDARLRRMVDQVGAALQTAHRSGVIHRDVKSANVLIDDEDNFYLTDFGIAFTGADDEVAAALSTGSPAYASPEQLRRQSLDHRTDVYGFGITLFEAATGRLPFIDAPTQAAIVQRQLEDPVPAPSSVETSVPRWVDDVVARATAKNPADRFASMAELVAAAVPSVGSRTNGGAPLAGSNATVIGELVNPFKALRAFREADTADFHGRDRLVARFVEVLSRPGAAGRLLTVVGPSGSGKSSAVRSGLLPRLRAGAAPNSDEWFITTMHPGSRPFEELESALSRVAVRQPGPLVELMRDDPRGVARAINQILPDEDSELLLVIDQFEEVFTHASDDERVRFLDGLLAAVREPRARLRVVVTIRADFWDRPLRHPGLAARVETAAVTVSPLAADELEAAIVEPVRRQGAQYEPGLVARIIADVGDQPGALPLLQYALTELFDRHVSGLIRAESYDAIGGLTGALASRAEAAFCALSSEQQVAARRLFGRLVTLGEGTEDTRRRVRLAELSDDTDTNAVVDAFGSARMLVFDVDPATREPTVEIAHEALLRAWPRLRGWLDEDRDGIRIHRHLTDTTAAWLASGRDAGELYRGGRLETAEVWASDHAFELNDTEREFLDASISTRQAEEAAEREHLEQQERANRRLRVLATIAAVVALIAATAGAFALQQQSRADDNAAEAARQALEANRQADVADERAAEAEAARESAETNADLARDRGVDADEARVAADQSAFEARELAALADLQRMRSDVGLLSARAAASDDPDAGLAMLLAVELARLDPSPDSDDALHRALTAGPANFERLFAGGSSTLEEALELPPEQRDLLADPVARLHTAILDGGQSILTSVETPDTVSTAVRHVHDGRSWTMIDTGERAVVTSSGEFTVWTTDVIVVRDRNGDELGVPIVRPTDLISVELSENGQVLVLQRPNGVLDVHRTTGELIGSVSVPDADPGVELVVSVLADGSTVAAYTFSRVGPWAMWDTDPLQLRTNGFSGFEFGARDVNKTLDFPVLEGARVFTAVSSPPDSALLVADPDTLELGDDRRFVYGNGAIGRLTTEAGAQLIAGVRIDVFDGVASGAVRVWDERTGVQLGRDLPLVEGMPFEELRGRGGIDATFDGSGRLIVRSPDAVSVWNYDTSTWADIACATAGRNMTRAEWERYGPAGVEYRKTCEQYPITS